MLNFMFIQIHYVIPHISDCIKAVLKKLSRGNRSHIIVCQTQATAAAQILLYTFISPMLYEELLYKLYILFVCVLSHIVCVTKLSLICDKSMSHNKYLYINSYFGLIKIKKISLFQQQRIFRKQHLVSCIRTLSRLYKLLNMNDCTKLTI